MPWGLTAHPHAPHRTAPRCCVHRPLQWELATTNETKRKYLGTFLFEGLIPKVAFHEHQLGYVCVAVCLCVTPFTCLTLTNYITQQCPRTRSLVGEDATAPADSFVREPFRSFRLVCVFWAQTRRREMFSRGTTERDGAHRWVFELLATLASRENFG